MSNPVATGLNATLMLYTLMSIQNYLVEDKNSILQAILRLRGPKTIESMERCIRATLKIRNNPELLDEIRITRNMSGVFFFNKQSKTH